MDSLDYLEKEDLSEIPSFVIRCAVSYAIGRKTYAVGIVTDFLKSRWNELTPGLQRGLQAQIQAARDRDDQTPEEFSTLGDPDHRRQWLEILELPVSTDD